MEDMKTISHRIWNFDDTPPMVEYETIAALLLAIGEATMMNKLAGYVDFYNRDMTDRANGQQIKEILDPNYRGFAFYFLRGIDREIKWLSQHGFITLNNRWAGPSGYGDDEEFILTTKGTDVLSNHRDDLVGYFYNQDDNGMWIKDYS